MSLTPEGQGRAGAETSRRLFVYNGGFLTQTRIRRILHLAGWHVTLGLPAGNSTDAIGVWGAAPTAARGETVSESRAVPVIRIEDPFLRSLHPGRNGSEPLGLLIDETGLHFDPTRPSDLETLLATHPLDDSALLDRARGGMARMAATHLSKYSATRLDAETPEPGYVLVVDQTQGDASVTASRGDRARFLEMLTTARLENPHARILIKTHPETRAGHRPGHFRPEDAEGLVSIYDGPASPKSVLDGAIAVYTLSSQLGFEAIIAGHRPRVFGHPFYAGWGLTEDEEPLPRRRRTLTRSQLFAAAMILYPTWYDPYRDRLARFEDVLDTLDAQTRAWREDRGGWVASGMRLWKRRPLQTVFGTEKPVRFADPLSDARRLAADSGRSVMVWANKAPGDAASEPALHRVEDGFLRSAGLGAALVPPLSLVCDDLGIYYDPTRPSRLEQLIARRAEDLRPDQALRARALIRALCTSGVTKYNLNAAQPRFPKPQDSARAVILVPGQVEDDASIRLGAPTGATNDALLDRVRAERPGATILYKPHPDVEAGLRPGALGSPNAADVILADTALAPLFEQVSELWTWTSLAGFEALLRGVPVTTLGAPFYAGWGLTRDIGPIPARRLSGPRPSLEALVHAALIDYPRYHDPVTGLACPVEVIVERLATGTLPQPGRFNRILSKLQGLFASQAHLWRR
ncbi:capsular polysaccharide biosynthesis protein [Cognatishimia sp. F0-27]|uniref:capsular polysaccharide biosynthesis protein n=1 Tax=Cognatishimia sp. F0-27 TaxID=2816855 RepID=UPI001D0C5759|nr:capsular polysaccharide biosynthesis protein [Cognatishimia sp. F0-27]MCC1491738.1 capsular polysaccharide biosynthesis protein [Cognatishimia sp. F0-27]